MTGVQTCALPISKPAVPIPATGTNTYANLISITTPPVVTTVTTVTTTTTIPSAGTVTVVTGVGGFTAPHPALILATTLVGTITVAANLAALVWFGMWMGLNSKSGNVATLKTLLYVQIIPWFVISFASMMIVPFLVIPRLMQGGTTATKNFILWFPLVMVGVASGLALVKDLVFVICSRRLLHSKFRERAAQAVTPIRLAAPPQINQPPVAIPRA